MGLARFADAESRIEVGGYAGGTSTTMTASFDCPPPTSPNDVCVTSAEPHEGAHGVSFGAYARVSLVPTLQVEANLLYAQKGYDVSPEVRMHYLEVPVLLRIDPLRGRSPARVFAYAGLAPSVLVRCTASGTRFDNAAGVPVPFSDACGYWPFYPQTPNRFDLGAVVGGGVGWDFSFGTFELQARYVQGIVDNGTWGEGGVTAVNKAFSVLAGYGRTLGKR
jgi:hypothetical protein